MSSASLSSACNALSTSDLHSLDFAEQVRRAVLKSLEGADEGTELLALLEVFDGAFERLLGNPKHLSSGAYARHVQDVIQQWLGLVKFPKQAVSMEFNVVELNGCCSMGIQHRDNA